MASIPYCVMCGEHHNIGNPCITNTKRLVRDPLLVEREKTHGDFRKQGCWAQEAKDLLRKLPNWDRMAKQQCEVLDMIMTKISRAGFGDSDHKDTWDDIAGYAKLGAEACDGQ